MTDDATLAPVLLSAADVARRLMIVAGPAANDIIVSSRQRLLACLRAGDADGAALEMERHLTGLRFMSRLAGDDPGAVLIVRRRRPAEQAAGSPGALRAGIGDRIRPDQWPRPLHRPAKLRAGEPQLTKTSHNAFTTTNLQQLLTQQGITEVIVCGIRTQP
jgi:nicotinamidase-related amidase